MIINILEKLIVLLICILQIIGCSDTSINNITDTSILYEEQLSLGYFDSDFNWVYYDDGGYKIDDDVVYKRGTVSNLEDIKHFRNLRELAICCTSISDISPLSELDKLWDLNLNMNQINDLTPLSSLTNLHFLYLQNNQISDLTPLSILENLHYLSLENNQINEWAPVAHISDVQGRPIN